MKGGDRGRAFREVSRSAQATAGKAELYRRVVASQSYPVQIVWAAQDPAMPVDTYGERAQAAAGLAYAGAQGVATTQLVSSAHEVAVSQGLVPGGPSLAR